MESTPPMVSYTPITTIVITGPPLPLNTEFEPDHHAAAFVAAGLAVGRCFGSKSGYRQKNPRSIFLPNANVFSLQHGKLWWGDLDLRKDRSTLEKAARALRCRLFVLLEMDGRFKSAVLTQEQILGRAVWRTGGRGRGVTSRQLRDSSLNVTQLACLLCVSRRTLVSRQSPQLALELRRRMLAFEKIFSGPAAAVGGRHWTDFWSTPLPLLNGEAPIEVWRSGRELDFNRLVGRKMAVICCDLLRKLQDRIWKIQHVYCMGFFIHHC